MSRKLVAWVLVVLLAVAHAEQRVNQAQNGYHFGPHAKHTALKASEFRRMALEDIDRLQSDLLTLFGERSFEQPTTTTTTTGISGSGSVSHPLPASVSHPLPESVSRPLPASGSPATVQVPEAVRTKWLQMRQALKGYYTSVHDSLTLDSRFTMFSSGASSKFMSILKSVITLDAAEAFQEKMVSVKEDLRAGKLNTAQAAIDSCISASTLFTSVYEISATAKGLVNSLLGGIGEGIDDVATALSTVGDEVVESLLFDVVKADVSVIDALLEDEDEDTVKPELNPGTIATDITNTTVSVAVDITYSILTLGIGPLIGFVAGRIMRSVEIGWKRDKEVASCILGAFGAMSEGLGVFSSVGGQGVQYRVTSEADLIVNAGKFTDLLQRALAEYKKDPSSPTSGVISSEDVYDVLEEDFKVLSKFKNVADIISGPASGISSTIRQYANGNEFEKASKYAGASVVAFTKNTFWREFFVTITNGAVPMGKAGFFNKLVVTGNTRYRTLYTRFGRGHDYGPGGEYQKSYGCDKDGECWVYCGADWKGGEYCYSQDPYKNVKSRQKCRTKQDCYNAIAPVWSAFKDVPCASTCVLFWHVGG